ncbi:hypothetical protein [Pseudomonas sp. CFBP 5748]
MAVYDLYGIKGITIIEAKLCIERSLMFSFEERDSTYQGGYYRFGSIGVEEFVLKLNVDPFDGEAVEQKFPEYPVLLYVNMTNRSEEIGGLLSEEFCLLRHEVYD